MVLPNRAAYTSLAATTTKSVQLQISAAHMTPSLPQQAAIHPYSLPQVPDKYFPSVGPSSHSSQTTPAADTVLTMKNSTLTDTPLHNSRSISVSSQQIESISNIKPAFTSFNAEERRQFSIPSNPLLPTTARPQIQQQQQHFYEPSLPTQPVYSKQIGKPSAASDSWRGRQQGLPSNYYQNDYNSSFGGHAQPRQMMMSGSQWEEGGEEFESWSPDNSPARNASAEYMMARNFQEHRSNNPGSGHGYGPDRFRHRNPSGNRDHHNRLENRRWRDRRR